MCADLLKIELHFNERQAAWIATELEVSYQGAVCVGLVVVSVKNRAFHLLKKVAGGLGVHELDANRQKIHAVADEIAIFQQGLTSGWHADDDGAFLGHG